MNRKPLTLAQEIREAFTAFILLILEISCIGAFLAGIAFIAARVGI